MWLNTLLCSECFVILDWYHSPCLSWDPPNVDDLGRVALLGRDATPKKMSAFLRGNKVAPQSSLYSNAMSSPFVLIGLRDGDEVWPW